MPEMLTLDAFEQASEKVKEVTIPTELVESPHFSQATGQIACSSSPENMQRTGAYKVRGAYYKISTPLRPRSSAAASSPLVLAIMLRVLHLPLRGQALNRWWLCPPPRRSSRWSAPSSMALMSSSRATCTTKRAIMRLSWPNARDTPSFTPSTTPVVATGQGTIAMEIVQELPLVDAILVPVGGWRSFVRRGNVCQALQPQDQSDWRGA